MQFIFKVVNVHSRKCCPYDGDMIYANLTLIYIVVRHPNMLHLFVEFAYALYPLVLLLSQHYFIFLIQNWHSNISFIFHLDYRRLHVIPRS